MFRTQRLLRKGYTSFPELYKRIINFGLLFIMVGSQARKFGEIVHRGHWEIVKLEIEIVEIEIVEIEIEIKNKNRIKK